jgi:hypothetical protein
MRNILYVVPIAYFSADDDVVVPECQLVWAKDPEQALRIVRKTLIDKEKEVNGEKVDVWHYDPVKYRKQGWVQDSPYGAHCDEGYVMGDPKEMTILIV